MDCHGERLQKVCPEIITRKSCRRSSVLKTLSLLNPFHVKNIKISNIFLLKSKFKDVTFNFLRHTWAKYRCLYLKHLKYVWPVKTPQTQLSVSFVLQSHLSEVPHIPSTHVYTSAVYSLSTLICSAIGILLLKTYFEQVN